MVIFILFFSIFLAACGIGNIWCQLLGKRHYSLSGAHPILKLTFKEHIIIHELLINVFTMN